MKILPEWIVIARFYWYGVSGKFRAAASPNLQMFSSWSVSGNVRCCGYLVQNRLARLWRKKASFVCGLVCTLSALELPSRSHMTTRYAW